MHVNERFKDDAALANRYLADQLCEAERDKFEAHLLRDPEVVRELEATARLKVGLRRLREAGELAPLLRPKPMFTQPWGAALAASIAVLAICTALFHWSTSPPSGMLATSVSSLVDSSGEVLRVGATHALLPTRAEKYDAVIELPETPQAIEFRVLPDSKGASYRVNLARLAANDAVVPIATLQDLEIAADGFITVFVDSSRLEPGRYLLAVSAGTGENSSAATSTFLLKVARTTRRETASAPPGERDAERTQDLF